MNYPVAGTPHPDPARPDASRLDPARLDPARPDAPRLDPTADVVTLTRTLCDIPSVSGQERALADAVEACLRRQPHLEVLRDGDAVVARTALGRRERVILAGHLDTVPIAGNLPTRLEGNGAGSDGVGGGGVGGGGVGGGGAEQVLWGRGTVDMKGGVAVQLHLAATLPAPARDVTYVFYDQEEVEAVRNGLGRLVARHPRWLAGDFAVLGEPSNGTVEGGCQGTLRVEVTVPGVAAHSARPWTGRNAVHEAAEVLDRLRRYRAREADVDGLVYREGLSAVGIRGGVAGNVIPDECVVTVNYRFAPDRTPERAEQHVREVFAGYQVRLTDCSPGARPGLDHPAARSFVAAIGRPPTPKFGWTDVARFATLGIPAVNFGPGDPLLAHKDDERCPVSQIVGCEQALRTWLTTPTS